MSTHLPHDISEQQLQNWIMGIRGTIWSLLETIEVLLIDLGQNPTRQRNVELITTALYTHALEEYGKLVLLSTLEPRNNRVSLDPINRELLDHDVKIQLALEDLPAECGRVIVGIFDPAIFDPNIFHTHNTINWDTRLNIFNTDIDSNGNVVNTPVIDLNGLQLAINEFRTAHFLR